jgi:hypothetical protein
MASAAIDPRAPVAPPGSATVDSTSRSPRDRRRPRDGRRPAAPPAPPPSAEDDPEEPPPVRGRLDILA